MKHLRQYIRQILLTEAAKQPEGLLKGHTVEMHNRGYNVRFSLMWRPSPEGSPIETGKITILKDPGRSGPCSGAWEVVGADARDKFGPILYDVAMEYAGSDGLMADRRSVSRDANRVWNFYLNSRPDVKPKQLDVNSPQRFKGIITPNDESDDCQQDMFMSKFWADNPEQFNKGDDVEVYLGSSLTKAFVKQGTPTTDKLKELGKWVEL